MAPEPAIAKGLSRTRGRTYRERAQAQGMDTRVACREARWAPVENARTATRSTANGNG